MCIVSMVHDHYQDVFRKWTDATRPVPIQQPLLDSDALRRLMKEFREAVEAAKTVDRLTAQPDCVDPEKAKLEARVAQLEAQLNAVREAASPAGTRGGE